jgi:uncharacterized membrane protein YedE/YeeE
MLDAMSVLSMVRALGGGALIGLAASLALVAHGRIAGISGTLGRVFDRDGGAAFRVPFLAGMIAIGIASAWFAPAAIGAAVRGLPTLAIAGLLVGVGTTLGNGCTSGHGVCGLARFSPRSLVAVVVFMATGALTVAIAGAHA